MNSNISHSLTLMALIIAGYSLTTAPAHAQADCTQWDVSKGWYAIQSNNFRVEFQLQQTGTGVRGRLVQSIEGRGMSFGSRQEGTVSGSIRGNSLELNTGLGGVYLGRIDATGRIDGTTYDKSNSTARARWYSDRRMNCLTRASDAPAPAPLQSAPPPNMGKILKSARKKPVGSAAAATCKSGFVWREARADDLVCVTPESRARVAAENRTAASRVQAWGGFNCRSGFVWREAFSGDTVCVTPAIRAAVREENRLGPSRRVQQ